MSATQPPVEPIDALYTVNETSRLLRVKRQTIGEWEKRGLLCPIRIGRTIRFRRSDLMKLIDSSTAR